MATDYVGNIIDLKAKEKEIQEKIKATETVIFNSPELRADERITISKPRETIILTDDAYERLEVIGIETTVVETRQKDFKEFPEEVKEILLSNEQNYSKKFSKESIRVKVVKA